MGRRCVDPDFLELQEKLGADKYRELYRNIYTKTRNHGEARFSGLKYKNSDEKLLLLKAKYKNGVPDGVINELLGIVNG